MTKYRLPEALGGFEIERGSGYTWKWINGQFWTEVVYKGHPILVRKQSLTEVFEAPAEPPVGAVAMASGRIYVHTTNDTWESKDHMGTACWSWRGLCERAQRAGNAPPLVVYSPVRENHIKIGPEALPVVHAGPSIRRDKSVWLARDSGAHLTQEEARRLGLWLLGAGPDVGKTRPFTVVQNQEEDE